MELSLPTPISSLLSRVDVAVARDSWSSLLTWLGKLPITSTRRGDSRRERWLAKRQAPPPQVARRREARAAGLKHVPLEVHEAPQDWPSEWHSMVQAVMPAPSSKTKRRQTVEMTVRERVSEPDVEGQAFLSLFSANADRMQDLQVFAQEELAPSAGREWWR